MSLPRAFARLDAIPLPAFAIFTCDGDSVCIWRRGSPGRYFLFDSHKRNARTGLRDPGGRAVLGHFSSMDPVLRHLRRLHPIDLSRNAPMPPPDPSGRWGPPARRTVRSHEANTYELIIVKRMHPIPVPGASRSIRSVASGTADGNYPPHQRPQHHARHQISAFARSITMYQQQQQQRNAWKT